ncbi:sensor histidine kinase [Flavobacterium antarcticum]|uniref:sensor histidine kinase n=1 Tax=Flavobacterium antarcticum TaxID=271155 RepID=UPI0003B78C81|nr:histidine kinase [Flavobacterium antarcticum]
MKLTRSYKYHIINLIGWMLYVFSTLTFDKLSYGFFEVEIWTSSHQNRFNYLIAEGTLCAILGFLLSYIILYLFEKSIDFSNVKKKNVVILVAVFFGVQVLYHILLWPMLDIPAVYYLDRTFSDQLSFLMKLANIPFFFVAFLVWFFVVASYEVFQYLNVIKLNKLELEGSLKEAKLNTLKGQINPHFMFNSLNNIRGLVLEDPNKSREMITRLSEMLRFSLLKNDMDSIKLEEEIEVVDNFIAISKIQMEERLQFIKEIEPETLNMKIPPMVIQLLVENAIKHGISNYREGGLVKLTTKISKDNLIIEVQNTGQLTISQESTQLGLKNIKDRISLLYGKEASFKLEEIENNVIATIILPLKQKDE